jgi:gamma-glutamyltranspeptidase/glutathione hydrolase
MTPTMVSELPKGGKPGKLRLVLGSPGGSTIITTVANDIISVVDNGMNVQAAADAPRFHHQWMPDQLQVEKLFPLDVVKAMEERGYSVKQAGAADAHTAGVWGDSELISVDPKTGMLAGANDYRYAFGKAAGY